MLRHQLNNFPIYLNPTRSYPHSTRQLANNSRNKSMFGPIFPPNAFTRSCKNTNPFNRADKRRKGALSCGETRKELLLILKQTLSPDFEAVKNSDILIYEEKNETQSFHIENIGVKGCKKKKVSVRLVLLKS